MNTYAAPWFLRVDGCGPWCSWPNTKPRSTMTKQLEIAGTEAPDRIPDVEDAIHRLLDAKVEASRVSKDARDDVKNKRAVLGALFTEHGLESHPYTCPKTNKPKRFWFANELKDKTARERTTKKNDEVEVRDADDWSDKPQGFDDTPTDNVVEMRRVKRTAEHDAAADPFAATRSAMDGGSQLGALEMEDAEKDGVDITPKKRKGKAKR